MLGNNIIITDLYYVHTYSYIFCQPNDGLSGQSMLLNQQRNKQFFYVLLTMHLDILCNENQVDTLFILNLFCRGWVSSQLT
jgi:hypothetical protein